MQIRFFFDRDTGLPHIAQHNVEPMEAIHALRHRQEDFPGRNAARIAHGQTSDGRYLRVIYREDKRNDSLLIITAYDLTGKALSAFKRRRRRRQ